MLHIEAGARGAMVYFILDGMASPLMFRAVISASLTFTPWRSFFDEFAAHGEANLRCRRRHQFDDGRSACRSCPATA